MVSEDLVPGRSSAMTEPRKSKYSLWLSPRSSETIFTDLIVSLSTRFNPPTIPFSPHATLFSDALIPPHFEAPEILSAVQAAVESLSPPLDKVVCKFDNIEAGKLFFQCVYIKLDKQNSEGLLELHRALRMAFKDITDPEGESYFPHMSLVYGDLEMDQKQALIASMRKKEEVKTLQRGREEFLGEISFETDEILVVKTSGRSDEWEIVGKVKLGGTAGKVPHQDL